MRLILKPQSPDNLNDIVIDDGLFPVGRAEEPFASYPDEVTEHLSRRHARIFIEGDGAYIADLGSRNGTRLNDKRVEFRPMRLFAGDTLCFASRLQYRVEIPEQESPAADETPPPVLELLPCGDSSALEPIVVTRFPFLVGKSEAAFRAEGADSGQQLDYLSRRHAHVFNRGGQLYLEDLGSTNGTRLNGQRLDEHARALASGDVVSFGGEHFRYTVQLREGAAPEPGAEASDAAPAPEGHTRFITAADSFLDIFCVDPQEPGEAGADAPAGPPVSTEGQRDAARRGGPWRRSRRFFSELRDALAAPPGERRSRRFLLPLLLALALGGGIAYLYLQPQEREVQRLLDSGQYRLAAGLAKEELAQNPASEKLSALATQALLRFLVPDWQHSLAQRDYTGARQLIHEARPLASEPARNEALLQVLDWITDLQEYLEQRGGLAAPVSLYGDGDRLAALLDWWDRDRPAHRGAMGMISEQVRGFEPLSREVYSQLRSLRNDRSVYLAAGDKLKRSIAEALAAGEAAALAGELDAVARQYPRLAGIGALRRDLEQYLAIASAIDAGKLVAAAELVRQASFATPPFQQEIQKLQSRKLPSAEILEAYSRAAKDWRSGQLERALEQLETLQNQPGGEWATEQLQAKRRLISDYATLQTYRGKPEYGDRLVRFYSTLDPDQDQHFVASLAGDFSAHSSAVRQRADEAWQRAQRRWRSYRDGGGIRGLLRLEERVTDEFEQQSQLLREAFVAANAGRQMYALLDVSEAGGQTALYADIASELALQRRSLEQLGMVLPPAVLEAKLGLLPDDAGTGQATAPGHVP